MTKSLIYLAISLVAMVASMLEVSTAYVVIDIVLGYTVTWPILFMVGWAINVAWTLHLRDSAKEEGLFDD